VILVEGVGGKDYYFQSKPPAGPAHPSCQSAMPLKENIGKEEGG